MFVTNEINWAALESREKKKQTNNNNKNVNCREEITSTSKWMNGIRDTWKVQKICRAKWCCQWRNLSFYFHSRRIWTRAADSTNILCVCSSHFFLFLQRNNKRTCDKIHTGFLFCSFHYGKILTSIWAYYETHFILLHTAFRQNFLLPDGGRMFGVWMNDACEREIVLRTWQTFYTHI